ncbi:MAG TPA: transcriptional regulator [Myxococcales bacterium]|mgnify:CR=1 FL=1|nr:transcriptional regulator [Myxococcales bacterium]
MPQVASAEDFGALVRERRRERGLSQQQLAAKVGVSRQWIVQVESGKPRAEVGLLLRVLNALDLVLRVEPRAEDSILDLVERLRGER